MCTTPESERAKAMAYTNQVAAEVQALFDSPILSGIKNKAKRLASAKLIVATLLRADGKDWAKQIRLQHATATKKDRYKNAIMKVAAQDLLREWNASVNRSKGKAGVSDTWKGEIGSVKDQNSYSSQPQVNPNAKKVDLSGIDRSQYTTTAECVQDIMMNHGADRQTAVNFCSMPGMNLKDNNGPPSNNNTRSASVQPDFVKIHNSLFPEQWGQTPYPTKRKSKVQLRNAKLDNSNSWVSTMKAMQRRTGLDPVDIAYHPPTTNKGEGSKLRSASSVPNSSTVPAVFKASNLLFKDVI